MHLYLTLRYNLKTSHVTPSNAKNCCKSQVKRSLAEINQHGSADENTAFKSKENGNQEAFVYELL